MNPEKIRKDFPIFSERPELVYLDNAATSQKPEAVIEAVENFYREKNANIGRGLYPLANDATQAFEASRRKAAEFIGAERKEAVFVRNTTEAVNLLASRIELEGKVLVPETAHHSNLLPWRENNELEFVETENGRIDLEDLESRVEEASMVAFSQVTNVHGVENPVEEVVEIAHENGAKVFMDAAQSAPRKSIDVKELDVDFLAFSGHKMMGPTGIGVLYGRKEYLEDLRPYQVGGGMVKSVTKKGTRYEDPPQRFEAGTPNVAGAAGLKAALDYLEQFDTDKVFRHDRKLCNNARKGLEKIEGVDMVSPEDAVVTSFTVKNAHPHDIAEVLGQKGVAVRAGHHCAQPLMEEKIASGTTRMSPYIYNTGEEVEAFIEAVEEAVEVFR
ncbi:MAG: aminotransferase class V-fold PLP-dependent enzyme [Candidatus Nanohaloarchaea archaeon]